MPATEPTAPRERFEVIDALRGFALLGVLAANLRDFSLVDFLPRTSRLALPTARWDHGLELAMAALVDAKFMTIFTLLFGVGFAMQMRRAEEQGGSAFYVRRLSILLLIGAVHAYLFWWGDILRFYAVLGLCLVPMGRCRPRTLATLGVFIALFASPLLRPVMANLLPGIAPVAQENAAALTAFSGGNVGEMWKVNFNHDLWSRLSAWGLPLYVFGRLLIGAALGRAGVLQQPERHGAFWRRLRMTALPLGLVLTAFVLLRDHDLVVPGAAWWQTEGARATVRIARSAASLSLGLGYMAIFVWLFESDRWRGWLMRFAPVGRMALTNYLLQTIIGLLLFYGIGLGIGPRFGLAGAVLSCAIIFAVQLALSRWWLRLFTFGPAEWAWRSLTYGKTLPLRRERS